MGFTQSHCQEQTEVNMHALPENILSEPVKLNSRDYEGWNFIAALVAMTVVREENAVDYRHIFAVV